MKIFTSILLLVALAFQGATASQPYASEPVLCRYIQKINKVLRVYNRKYDKPLPGSGVVKIKGAIKAAVAGNVMGSLDLLRAATKIAEGVSAVAGAEVAKVSCRQARNLAIVFIRLSAGKVPKGPYNRSKGMLNKCNAMFKAKQYSGALDMCRQATRVIVYSSVFSSPKLLPPVCPKKV